MATKYVAVAVMCALLVFALAVVSGQRVDRPNMPNASAVVGNVSQNMTNMTYGRCVSAFAKEKNTCFAGAQDARRVCQNATVDKAAGKQCGADYKKSVVDCKQAFKASKQTCLQYRKTLGDRLRFWQ